MAALGIPAFQRQSKRNLFADFSVAPAKKAENEIEEIVFSTDLAGIEIASVPPVTPPKAKSPKKRSPLKKSPSKKSPLKSPKKSPKNGEAPGFFTRLFYSVAGYNANGVYRPPPVAKGVYFDSRSNDVPENSLKTLDTAASEGEAAYVPEWIASNLENHMRGVPGLVRRPEYDVYNEVDDKKLLKKVMTKAKKLPQEPGKYASNHIMVNAERARRMIPPLRRERHMDQIAREQAKLMAEENNLFHIENPHVLKKRLKEKDKESNELPDFQRLGMNIGKGKDIAEVQRYMMAALAERNNIQDKRFFAMGMGTYTADNGVLFMCQVFGG